jgi:hypothetical protein
MARRKPYTKVTKSNQIRADHVRGMGDVVFVGFQCLSATCENWIFEREDELGDQFEIVCEECGTPIYSGEVFTFYEYDLDVRGETIESGVFSILVDDYVAEAERFKYCIVCNTLKPLTAFDRHKARKSGRQGECRLCKKVYNSIKNQTRIADQHREAAQKRRLYLDFSMSGKIDADAIREKFDHKCFRCGRTDGEFALDHTLPALYLWPLDTDNATLLCRDCNGEKADKWPSDFYTEDELARLSGMTGIPLDTLKGLPHYNPEAMKQLEDAEAVDGLLAKHAARIDELIRLRNRVLTVTGFDFFRTSKHISSTWVELADEQLGAEETASSE